MINRSNSNNNDTPNKGFTIHVDETYIGFLTIGEFNKNGKRVMPETTAENMQKPENMAALLANAELHPYKAVEEADTALVDEIMASVGQEVQTAQESPEADTTETYDTQEEVAA